jgi:uncharacterized protein (TIGR02147 family)
MSIFNYLSYTAFLRDWIKSQSSGGRGKALQLANHIGVSTVLMSQIINGKRNLQEDYAFGIANHIGLNQSETDYLILLTRHDRAGNHQYKAYLKKLIENKRLESRQIKSKVPPDIELDEGTKAKFYSHWHFSAIRLATALPNMKSIDAIAGLFSLDKTRVRDVLDFLVKHQLCELVDGQYSMKVKSTHLESSSPWVYSRQIQWRNKSISAMENSSESSTFYTGPMVLSADDADWVQAEIGNFVKKIVSKAIKSKSEKLMCLNIDWFDIVKKQDQIQS